MPFTRYESFLKGLIFMPHSVHKQMCLKKSRKCCVGLQMATDRLFHTHGPSV